MEQRIIEFGESRALQNDDLVFSGEDGKPRTNSMKVANTFGKKHDKVLRDIRNLACSQEFRAANFGETYYLDAQGKRRPMFTMTRDGFTLLVMGYTGNKAMGFKEKYIDAFNRMEQRLKEAPRQLTAVEMFALQAQINLDSEKRMRALESRLDEIEKEREENARELLQLPVSSNPVPVMTMRKSIVALVNEYSAATNTAQSDVWHRIYSDLYYKYGKSINNYKKLPGERNKLDVAERVGLLQPMLDIISDMISNFRKNHE